MDAFHLVLSRAPSIAPQAAVGQWWPTYLAVAREAADPFDRALLGGFATDRVAWAFCAGYQAALHALVPTLPIDRVACLCATEEGGNHPRAIQTSLSRAEGGLRLDGDKMWTTLGPAGARLLVVARAPDLPATARGDAPPALRLVAVDSSSPGVTVLTMPPTRFVPEAPHARVQLRGVVVAETDLLDGDGYARYLKPFRTVEDIYVTSAKLAYLVREARAHDWPEAFVEQLLAVLMAMRALAARPASDPLTHLALAGTLRSAGAAFDAADTLWAAEPPEDDGASRWIRDRPLSQVAGKVRNTRRESAWRRLRG